MRKLLLLMSMCLCIVQSWAQNRTIAGTVKDEKGQPVHGASVTTNGRNVGTSTGSDGTFSLSVPSGVKAIEISAVGFKKQMIGLSANTSFSIVLENEDKQLDEVMVVAYGTVKKGANTSSTTLITAKDIQNRPLTNISSALDGAGPGIQTIAASGQPGSGQSIRIRGFGSINASNDPLIVLDGVPYGGTGSTVGSSTTSSTTNDGKSSGLADINMDDVESITTLKDAAATALYGARAANGVIVITTKKGKKGKPTLSAKVSQGFTSRAIPEYDRMNAFQYYPVMWQAYRNSLVYGSGQAMATANQSATDNIKKSLGYNPFRGVADNDIVRTDGTLNPSATTLLWGDDLDWTKEMMRQGQRQEYGLSYGSGTEKSDFFASVGYLKEKGYLIKSDYEKFTARLNANAQPADWFKTGLNISGTLSNSNAANDGSSTGYINPFYFIRNMGPIYPVYAHNQTTGDYLLDGTGNRFYDLGNMSALGIPNRPAGASPGRHIVEETQLNNNLFKKNIASARGYTDVIFTKELKFTVNLSADVTNYLASTYDNNVVGDGAPAGRASKNSTTTTAYTFNQLLTYNKTFDKHNISVLAGHENYSFNYNYLYGSSQQQAVDGNTELVNFSTINSLTSYTDNYKIESYLSRINYDFDSKYFLSASLRRDGNSRFKKEFRWDNFWSLGGGWRIDKESFMKGISWAEVLKLRASYGRVGNDAGLGYYPYQALYALQYNNGAEPGIRQSALPNDSLRWEGAKSADIGIDFSLLKNRLSGSIEYYHRTTDHMIFPVQYPLSNGGYTVSKNIGEMVNKGWEIQLSGDAIRKKDFKWRVDVSWSTLKNVITKMPPGQPTIISGTKQLQVGHSLYDYWLRDWQGVDPSDGASLYRANVTNATDVRVRGKGDTVTVSQNNAKYVYAGSAIPDFYGSIGNTFTYKAFELSFLFTYQVGGKIYDATYASLMNPGGNSYGSALSTDMLKAWRNPGDVTNVPRMDNSKGGIFDATSSRFLTNASFLNFRSATLSYNVPKAWLTKINSTSARLFLSGENLMWFSARKGMNVQQSFTGVTSNAYIPARTITMGLNVNF